MRIMFFLTAAWLLAAPSVALGYGIYTITSGSGHKSWEPTDSGYQFGYGQFALFGHGISFTGEGWTSYPPCNYWCTPGSTVDVDDGLDSEDRSVSGTVTIGGIETDYLASPGASPSIGLELIFSLELPSLGVDSQAIVTLTTPFTAHAWIDIPLSNAQEVEMIGQGTATVNLRLFEFEPWYEFQSATYSFMPQPQPAPIPEPKALHLLGGGMALLIFARRRCKL